MRIRVDKLPEEFQQVRGSIDPAEIKLDVPGYTLDSPLSFSGQASKTADDITMQGTLTGNVKCECSRCLATFTMPLDLGLDVVYVPRRERPGEEEEMFEPDSNLSYYDGESVNVLQEIKDLILVNLPLKPVCDPECKGLCPQCGADLNTEPCQCERTRGPSPFDKLKELKSKLEKQ